MTRETNCIGDDELQLIDFSEEDDYLIAFPFRDSLEDLRLSVTYDNLNECDRIKLFESINSQVLERIDQAHSESMEPRRPSILRKSLAWDSAFFTSAGVLNPEELFLINKGFNKHESNLPSPHRVTLQNETSYASKKTNIFPQNKPKLLRAPKSQGSKESSLPKLVSSKQINKSSVEGSDSIKTNNKTRKAGLGPDLTVSKRSRWGDLSGLPKSTSFTSPITQKDSKVHCSYESSSSASTSSKHSSKSIRRKINPKSTKPSASKCSSSTSPCSSIEGWFSESLSLSSNTNQDSPEFTSEHATTSSTGSFLFSGGPKRKIKSSSLRMPSPKIGFFDEEQPFSGNMQIALGKKSHVPNTNKLSKNKFQLSNLSPYVTPENRTKVRKTFNGEHDGRKVGVSFSKLKPDGQTPREISKNKMNIDRKKQKDEADESDQKENVCSFEDQVNGLTRYFEVIDLDRDLVPEVNGQLSVHYSRTPLAEKTSGKQ